MQIDKSIRDLILDRNVFIDKIKFISPNAECYLQSFTNHSDTPNVNLNYFATRDIKEGEEILENYRDFNLSELNKKHFTFL